MALDAAEAAWIGEAGGHRFQRIPATEKRGRIHTSTVTVAVIARAQRPDDVGGVRESDLDVSWFSGTGSGGQHRNKHQNSCRLLHIPSGITVKVEGRSRTTSYNQALSELTIRLTAFNNSTAHQARSNLTKQQIGSGMRGDKIRTYRLQDDTVYDHRSGRTMSWKLFTRGEYFRS